EEVDEVTGFAHPVILESPDEKKQPKAVVKDPKTGKTVKEYLLPAKAHLMLQDKDTVFPGTILAKIPRETTKTKDITGGLPRVVELFEARRPKEPAVITEIDGIVRYGEVVKGKRQIIVADDETGESREYEVPKGVHINIQEGERVRAGDPLIDGARDPHDNLRVKGKEDLQQYLVNEIQEVYRLQGVNINDKHIETIVRQIPAGTGMEIYRRLQIAPDGPPTVEEVVPEGVETPALEEGLEPRTVEEIISARQDKGVA